VSDLSFADVPAVAGNAILNLIRRGADGSLRLSADRWRLSSVEDTAVVFHSQHEDPDESVQVLEVSRDEVERVTWDRLPKQRARSQLRFHLKSGDLWTFSGELTDPA
jgi:hypothetical protein